MPKQTSLALVLALALALTTAAGCGNSAREDALEVVDDVEAALNENITNFMETSEKINEAIPEVPNCSDQPNVRSIAGGTFPFRDPSARELQVETIDLLRECRYQRRDINRGRSLFATSTTTHDSEMVQKTCKHYVPGSRTDQKTNSAESWKNRLPTKHDGENSSGSTTPPRNSPGN